MKPIGGYFGLELVRGSKEYHHTAFSFKSGRAAFNFILSNVTPRRVFIPFYCCDTLLKPLIEQDIHYEFYAINHSFEPKTLPTLSQDELFVYINYFDLKRDYANKLSSLYKDKLVVDSTQAFYLKGNGTSWFFNSCRKFFGVPDGSYLYVPANLENQLAPVTEENKVYRFDHLINRFNDDIAAGYPQAINNEELIDSKLLAMSRITRRLLSNVDYAGAKESRQRNFRQLQIRLGELNTLDLSGISADSTPLYFPLLPKNPLDKQRLWDKQLFMPHLWQDCLDRTLSGFVFEKHLSTTLIPLPIDQRYSASDMDDAANRVISSFLESGYMPH